jgi:hypothetical protein
VELAVVNAYGAIVLSVVGLMAVGQLAAWNSRNQARRAVEAPSPAANTFQTEETWEQLIARGKAEAMTREWEERRAEEKAQEEFDNSPQGKMMKKILIETEDANLRANIAIGIAIGTGR